MALVIAVYRSDCLRPRHLASSFSHTREIPSRYARPTSRFASGLTLMLGKIASAARIDRRARHATQMARDARRHRPCRDDHADKTAAAMALWSASVDPRGTTAETYLNSRSLELDADVAGEVIRWHPGINALVALFRSVESNLPQAVSRTFLDGAGKKIGRKFLGLVAGAAIMLDGSEEVTHGLHVGEGIETCLAARVLGLRPTWALGSASAIAAFPILSAVECITLLREHDDASMRATEQCAARWHTAGRNVVINESTMGSDLNDAIRRRA
jgi:putative DNA primase/helicase